MTNPAYDRMQTFCKQMLKTRTFLGHYQENRLVQSLQSYRALVVISKTDETLAKDIQIVRNRIKNFYSNKPEFWVGFTDPISMIGVPHGNNIFLSTTRFLDFCIISGACLWTELQDVPFGEYWFQIKTIRFRNNEAIIKLKMLKPMEDVEESIRQEQKIKENQSISDSGPIAKDWKELLDMWHKSCSIFFLKLFSHQFTAQNIAGVLKFICLLVLAAGTASIHGVMYLGAFTLKFMEEFRKLLHVSMPIILKIFDLLSKFIGGIFILLAMVWRDTFGRRDQPTYGLQGPQSQMPSLDYRAIEYRPDVRSARVITSRYRRS